VVMFCIQLLTLEQAGVVGKVADWRKIAEVAETAQVQLVS